MKIVIAVIAAIMIALAGSTAASATPVVGPASNEVAVTLVALPPGDTVETRVGLGALAGVILGGLAGLPFAVVGAIPGAIIGALAGAGIGAASWDIANSYSER